LLGVANRCPPYHIAALFWVKFLPFSNATQSQKGRQPGAILPFGQLRLALFHHLPLPLPPWHPKPLCFNTEYRCLRDDPLLRCEPIRSPYTNAFVDHRRAIASSVHDCAPLTNLVSPLVPLLPCIASERRSSRTTLVSYCVAALRVDVILPRFYWGDFTYVVYLLICLYSFRACRRPPLSSQANRSPYTGQVTVLPRFELMSSSRTTIEMISHVQFTYSSVSIHFVLVGAPLFLQDSLVFF
jgi:hypothetical protein